MKLTFRKLNGKLLVVAILSVIIVLSFSANTFNAHAASQKTVYIVINIAEQPSNEGAYLDGAADVHPSMDVNVFSPSSGSAVTQVFSTSYRNSIQDSFGGTFKLTWQCEMDYLMQQSGFFFTNGTTGVVGYTAMLDLMNKYWGTQIQNFGDALEYYHYFETYNGTYWNSYNGGPDSGYPNYQNIALDHMIIDDNFYPNVFWTHFYRNVVPLAESNWIEQNFPFEYTPTYGSTSPYNLYTGMNHYQIQTLGYYNYDNLLEAFGNAVNYGSSIYSIFMVPYADLVGNITAIQNNCVSLDNDHARFPNVVFKYVTAAQAMQLALGYTDTTPPTFTVTRNSSTYIISSSKTLWNNSPYVAFEHSDGSYTNIAANPVGTNLWTVTDPNSGSLVKVGVAASDLYGNVGTAVFSPLAPPLASIPSAPSLPPSHLPEVQLTVHGATASNEYNTTWNAGDAIDGIESPSNFWASNAGLDLPASLTLDLWNLTPVNQISTHFYDFDTRTYIYNIDFSNDGSTWTPVVIQRAASGVSNDTFSQTMTRYIRLTVTYCSKNNVANVEETKVFQQTLSPTPTPTPTPPPTATPTPTPSTSATPTPTPSTSATPSPSPSTSSSPTPTPTATPTSSPTVSPTPTHTSTPTPSPTPTSTKSNQAKPISQTEYYAIGAAVVIAVAAAATFMLLRTRVQKPQADELPPPPPPAP